MIKFKVGVLDLNDGHPNEGLRCIKYLIEEFFLRKQLQADYTVFDIRKGDKLPKFDSFDAYISSGGPGDPTLTGADWENEIFNLVDDIIENNKTNEQKIYFFAICHSFQLLVQHFHLATVNKRKSTSFGVMPTHVIEQNEKLLEGLDDPFYVVDSRDFQVIAPNSEQFEELGAKIVCLEKERPYVDLERAIMAIRFTDEIFGTQFHPEADAEGMHRHFQKEDKKKIIIDNFGEEKFNSMLDSLEDPDKIMLTESVILPTFLEFAFSQKFPHYQLSILED